MSYSTYNVLKYNLFCQKWYRKMNCMSDTVRSWAPVVLLLSHLHVIQLARDGRRGLLVIGSIIWVISKTYTNNIETPFLYLFNCQNQSAERYTMMRLQYLISRHFQVASRNWSVTGAFHSWTLSTPIGLCDYAIHKSRYLSEIDTLLQLKMLAFPKLLISSRLHEWGSCLFIMIWFFVFTDVSRQFLCLISISALFPRTKPKSFCNVSHTLCMTCFFVQIFRSYVILSLLVNLAMQLWILYYCILGYGDLSVFQLVARLL